VLSIHDMTRAQLGLMDEMGVEKLYASVGCSMGGMQSLSLAYLAPDRVGRVASISATGRSGLGGVGMRYAQRSGRSILSQMRGSSFGWSSSDGRDSAHGGP